jgi:hypothetical protein
MADKGLFIEALPRDGLVTFLALVKDKALRPKRTGGWYLYLLLSDRTGDLEGKAAMPGEVCNNYINFFSRVAYAA